MNVKSKLPGSKVDKTVWRKLYLETKFHNYRYQSAGRELTVPSLFMDGDWKMHMSINVETGLWRCFKTGETGNFISLYSIFEKISYRRAQLKLILLGAEDEFFPASPVKETGYSDLIKQGKKASFNTDAWDPVNKGTTQEQLESDPLQHQAYTYLNSRKVGNYDFFVCREGKYKNRLIIPYRNADEEIFYFNSRALFSNQFPKYLNPSSEEGVRSSHILYHYDEDSENPLIITEGVFDTLVFRLCQRNSTCTQGSYISDIQMDQIKGYKGTIIVAYDNDDAGLKGLIRFDTARKRAMMPSFKVAIPPNPYKDWNEVYYTLDDMFEFNKLFKNCTREYDYEFRIKDALDDLEVH